MQIVLILQISIVGVSTHLNWLVDFLTDSDLNNFHSQKGIIFPKKQLYALENEKH